MVFEVRIKASEGVRCPKGDKSFPAGRDKSFLDGKQSDVFE